MVPAALAAGEDPTGLPALAAVMWWDARGVRERAQRLVPSVDTAEGAWVHAHLHLREGDPADADHWYRRGGRRRPAMPLAGESAEIVRGL